MTKAAQGKEKQHRATEKPKLDNARKLRSTYFIDPDDMEFKKNTREELESSMESALSCKVQNLGHEKLVAKTNPTLADRNMHTSWKPTNLRESALERTQQEDHEDRIAGKGVNSLSHHTLVHKFIPVSQAMKIPGK